MPPTLTDLIDAELGKRCAARRAPELASIYEQRSEASQWQSARVSSQTAGIVYIAFLVTDAVLIPDVALVSIAMRFITGMLLVLGVDLLIRRGLRSAIVDDFCAATIVVAYATWLTCASTSAHDLNVSYYMTYGTLFMTGQNVFFNFRFRLAILSSTSMLAIFFLFLLTSIHPSFAFLTAIATLHISVYGLTLFVNWKLNEERYRVFLNSMQAEIRQAEAAERGAALLRLSTTDALTGLANRRAIDDELRTFWDRWQSSGKSFAVVLVDVDHFKRYNDHYGHQEGDRCLVAVAAAMAKACAPGPCVLGRFGGEEFILLFRCAAREQLASVAENVRRAVEDLRIAHEQRPDPSHIVTVSIGAALSSDVTGAKVERLITEADRALYMAKKSSRNCVRIFDRDRHEEVDHEESVANDLRTAIAEGRVAMVYQPIRQARTGRIVAAEALMRLESASGKSVSPGVFVPIAERTGAILELGRWAIRTVCRELIAGDHLPLVSVNVSAVQLRSPGFAVSVAAILIETGVAPHRLAIEITEGLQIDGQPEIKTCIDDLRTLGVKVWLDDFGTGFAGLSCVREIEIDTIKIDRSFLHAAATQRGAQMLSTMIELVKSVGSAPLIEGIETQEQEALAIDRKVDLLQGFHIGKPMPVQALAAFLAAQAGDRRNDASAEGLKAAS